MDPFCGTQCGTTTVHAAPPIEVTAAMSTGPSVPALYHSPSSERMLEDMDNAMMLSRKPEQLVKSLRIHHTVVEATLQELERAILESQSATSQLNVSVTNAVRQSATAGQDVIFSSPAEVARMHEARATKIDTQNTHDLLAMREIKILDGTLLGKIYGDVSRKRGNIKWPSRKAGWWPFVKGVSRIIVDQQWFECMISLAIVVNSIMLGVESQMSLTLDVEAIAWSRTAEICFLVIFTCEILLRLVAHGWRVVKDGWFIFDGALVLIAYVEQFLQIFSTNAQQVLVLRTMRLFRLIRTFRMIKQIKSIWRLVYGLITCGETIISTFMLLFIVLYVFGVMGVELITKDPELRADPDVDALVIDRFSSLPLAMMTLVQFVTMDSIHIVYAPLIKRKTLVLGLYFGLLICVVSISLMNLVTAVMVEGALEHARQEKEEEAKFAQAKAKQMVPEIIELFDAIDADGSGEVDLKEMAKFSEDGLVPDFLFDKASVDSMTDLFYALDVDQSGIITRHEFIEGLLNLFLRDTPVSVQLMLKMMRQMRADVSRIQTNVEELDKTMDILRPDATI